MPYSSAHPAGIASRRAGLGETARTISVPSWVCALRAAQRALLALQVLHAVVHNHQMQVQQVESSALYWRQFLELSGSPLVAVPGEDSSCQQLHG